MSYVIIGAKDTETDIIALMETRPAYDAEWKEIVTYEESDILFYRYHF